MRKSFPQRFRSYPLARLEIRYTSLLFAFMAFSLSFRQGLPGQRKPRESCRNGIWQMRTRCPKKKEGREAPPSGQPISRLPACQFALPESIRALWGRTPMHGKFYRGHARYACRRTPRQTSGLPAGAELSLESKDIIASTNPECSDTFENNRATQLHRCTATELQSHMATHREEYDDYFAVQTFGAITPGAL